MSQLEDVIRASLRSEADRLQEVTPLRLPPAGVVRPRLGRALRPRPWYAPLAAAAAIVLIAAGLVAAKTFRDDHAAPAPATPGRAAPFPRYYVALNTLKSADRHWAIAVGDARTGKTIGSYPLPAGHQVTWSANGAADDRTFVVKADVSSPSNAGQPGWYRVRVFPGTARPVRVTSLGIQAKGDFTIALSGDGSELAVVDGGGKSLTLSVYSVRTGRLLRSWSSAGSVNQISGLSWTTDRVLSFAWTDTPKVRQEVRTLSLGTAGRSLLGDSRQAWSQTASQSPSGELCRMPQLTGNGKAVVCAVGEHIGDQLEALWLAYPLATPGRARVIGRVVVPGHKNDFTQFTGFILVEWVNAAGTEVIGSWMTQIAGPQTVHHAYIGGGKVREFKLPNMLLSPTW